MAEWWASICSASLLPDNDEMRLEMSLSAVGSTVSPACHRPSFSLFRLPEFSQQSPHLLPSVQSGWFTSHGSDISSEIKISTARPNKLKHDLTNNSSARRHKPFPLQQPCSGLIILFLISPRALRISCLSIFIINPPTYLRSVSGGRVYMWCVCVLQQQQLF